MPEKILPLRELGGHRKKQGRWGAIVLAFLGFLSIWIRRFVGYYTSSRSWKRSTRLFMSWAWLESSSLAAALSSAVAELVCTTLEICSMPSVI